MRVQGRLTEWNDERGFGFITPLGDGSKLFVHVSEFPQNVRRPLLNDLVTYESSTDERGRLRAVRVLHLTPVRAAALTSPQGPESLRRTSRMSSSLVIPILAVALVVTLIVGIPALMSEGGGSEAPVVSTSTESDLAIQSAFANQQSGVQVQSAGTVVRVLSDDTNGSRHQRFILRLASGQTLLVAHNIDIAPRVEPLSEGANVVFSGVYEWNAEGGVIHWTHHDPQGQHAAGWLECNGYRYQ